MKTILILFTLLLGCASLPHAEEPSRQKMELFLQTPSARKLNPALQQKLLALETKGAEEERLTLLLGLKTPPTEADKNRLRQEGALLRSVLGTVATATAPAGKIPAISRLDFVETIELATSFKPKGEADEAF